MAAAGYNDDDRWSGERFAGSRWDRDTSGVSATDRGGAAALFGGLTGGLAGASARRPAYRRDAYEEAPRIRQGGEALRISVSPGLGYGIAAGALLAALLLFVAGFLAAVWLVAPDGLLVQGAPSETRAQTATAERGAMGRLVPSAVAGDAPENPAPPAPEIVAALDRAQRTEAASAPGLAPEVPRARVKPLDAMPNASDGAEDTVSGGGIVAENRPAEDMGEPAAETGAEPPAPAPPEAPRSGLEGDATFTAPQVAAAPSPGNAGPIAEAPYILQFGAFRERGNAADLIARIGERLPAHIVEGRDSAGRSLYFVRGGGFDSLAAARAESRRLEETAGLKSFARRTASDDGASG